MRKLFLIAPHFPPSALPPSQRMRLMVPHWRKLGFEVTVFTVAQRFREETADPWMAELVGHDFRCVELPALPHEWTRRLGIGDLGIRFIPFLLPRLLFEIVRARPDFILWPVPPWYLLTVAPLVGALTGVPYGIDYIDPWVDPVSPRDTLKQKLSQSLARIFEGYATRRASVLYAVSPGILDDLRNRYGVGGIPARAIPYGVEREDFSGSRVPVRPRTDDVVVRYIGAVWEDGMRPLAQIMRAFGELQSRFPLRIEFFGTSYAGVKSVSNLTDGLRDRFGLGERVSEQPRRVSYQKAVELTLGADLLFLFGGMLPYYAASKLMGLIASQRPFLAFVHRDSSPFDLLHRLGYPYLVGYSNRAGDAPEDVYPELVERLGELLSLKSAYQPIDWSDPLVQERSALGMTQQFAQPILDYLEGRKNSV